MSKNDQTTTETTQATALSPLDRRRAQIQLAKDYRGMSFADAKAAAAQDQVVVTAADAGMGYRLIENRDDKEHLVGISLMVLPGWQVNPSGKIPGRFFTSAYVKTEYPVPQLGGGTEFILNDGSTGIAQQLAELRTRCIEQELPDPVVMCAHGLKKSEYEITDVVVDEATGEPVIDRLTNRPKRVPRLDPVTQQPLGKGVTYYLDTSA